MIKNIIYIKTVADYSDTHVIYSKVYCVGLMSGLYALTKMEIIESLAWGLIG
jgi:hypothetical protein